MKDRAFSKESIYGLGVQLLNLLEGVHYSGYIYNDLKLDNILFDLDVDLAEFDSTGNIFENININMIDFCFATRYLDKFTKEHIQEGVVDVFRGNMVFASANQL